MKGDIIAWRKGKRARGKQLAAMYPYERYSYIQHYQEEKHWVVRDIRLFSGIRGPAHAGLVTQMLEDAAMRRRGGFKVYDDAMTGKDRHRRSLESIRSIRLGSGTAIGDLEARTGVGGLCFNPCPTSGYLHEEAAIDAINGGLVFSELTLKMRAGRWRQIVDKEETRRGHRGYWFWEVHPKDEKLPAEETVRIRIYTTEDADQMWFKMKWG